jgi:hypothetical protein
MVTDLSMKEDRLLVFKTRKTLLYKRAIMAGGPDGMSDTSRMNRLTKQVNTIQDMASTVIDNSILSQKEMAGISKQAIKSVEKR